MTFSQKTFFACIVVIVSTVSLASAKEHITTLNLSEALEMALTRHVDVLVADERVKQALNRIQEKSAPLWPQLSGTVSDVRQTRDLRAAGFPLPGDPHVGPFNVYDARIRLIQTIFDPSAMARFKSSQQGHLLSLAQQKKTREDVFILVATLFLEAKRAQDNFYVTQMALRRDKKEMSITFWRLKSGLSSPLDMKKARAQYSHFLYNFELAKQHALERNLDLAAALDLPPDEKIYCVWDEPLFFKEVPGTPWNEDQPDIHVARQELALNEKDHTADQRDFWPKIYFSGDYGPSGTSPDTQKSSETYSLGISASIPIFQGGAQQARLKQSENAVKISQAQLQNVKRQVRVEFLGQRAMMAQAVAFLQETENNVAVAKEELRLARSQLRFGNGSSLSATSAEVNLSMAEDQKEEAQAYYLLAKIKLARSLGRVEQFLLEK